MNEKQNDENIKRRGRNSAKKNKNLNWILVLMAATIILSITMSGISSVIIQKINLIAAAFMLLGIILIGILFDIVGIAVAAADETPFHAMASSKVKGAKNAIRLVRNASKVTTFCNDVVGDVSGIISGSTSAFIVLKLSEAVKSVDIALLGITMGALVAALTVMGKGLGKTVAISKSNQIVYKVALLQYYTFGRINFRNKLKKELESRYDKNE